MTVFCSSYTFVILMFYSFLTEILKCSAAHFLLSMLLQVMFSNEVFVAMIALQWKILYNRYEFPIQLALCATIIQGRMILRNICSRIWEMTNHEISITRSSVFWPHFWEHFQVNIDCLYQLQHCFSSNSDDSNTAFLIENCDNIHDSILSQNLIDDCIWILQQIYKLCLFDYSSNVYSIMSKVWNSIQTGSKSCDLGIDSELH